LTNALNLPGYRILDFKQNKYDYLYVIEPDESQVLICTHCGSVGVKFKKHFVRYRDVVDLPSQNKRVLLRIKHRRYQCTACGDTFYELLNGIDAYAKVTKRLKVYIMEQAVTKEYEEIGEEVGLTGQSVKRYFEEVIAEVSIGKKLKAPRVLGIDEVYIKRRARGVFTDIENNLLMDILPDNTKPTVKAFILGLDGYKNIEAVTMDMLPAYRKVVKDTIPEAKAIIDKFHVVAATNQALLIYFNSVKRTATKEEKNYLWGMRKILLTGKEKLSEEQINNRDICFLKYPILKAGYWLKEDLRDVYKATDTKEAYELFFYWEESIPKDLKHFVKVKNKITRCKQEIINYFRFPNENLTNALTESLNRPTKDLVRAGRRSSFETIRAKVLKGQYVEKKPKLGELGFD
jgi:Transposase and inactivated derivatives